MICPLSRRALFALSLCTRCRQRFVLVVGICTCSSDMTTNWLFALLVVVVFGAVFDVVRVGEVPSSLYRRLDVLQQS